jgi:hypothetical protein
MAASKLKPLAIYRQSTLAGFEVCARRTRFAIERGDDDYALGWVDTSGDVGQVLHAVTAEIINTLRDPRNPEPQMPTQEAVEVMYEVYGAMDIVLPVDDLDALRWMVLSFCEIKWPTSRIATVEQRLTLELVCPDGVTRTLKGQPDAVLFDPPDGLIIPDWKSGMGRPGKPRDESAIVRDEDGEIALVIGKKYLSERGHFQLDTYGLLALKGRLDDGTMISPTADRVTLREYNLRWGDKRQATLGREELEHVERQLADHMMKLDRAISEGPKSKLWSPRLGAHCLRQCPVARSCPIPKEMRGTGALETQADADREAKLYVRGKTMYEQASARLKPWQEAGNPPGRVNDREEARWGPERDAWKAKGGGRSFGVWPVDTNGNGAGDGGA